MWLISDCFWDLRIQIIDQRSGDAKLVRRVQASP